MKRKYLKWGYKLLIVTMLIIYYVAIMLFFIRFILGITPEEWAAIPVYGA